jgi:hypothetical protein
MATNFPGSADTFPNPTSTTNTDDTGFELDVVISNLGDATEAVEEAVLDGGIGGDGSVLAVIKLTQAAYDALGTPNPNVLYVVT